MADRDLRDQIASIESDIEQLRGVPKGYGALQDGHRCWRNLDIGLLARGNQV
jgi:hypothetical protein